MGIFSAKYRRLAGEAWKCVARKTTFRKCDTNFKADAKARLLGKQVIKRPRLAKFLAAKKAQSLLSAIISANRELQIERLSARREPPK